MMLKLLARFVENWSLEENCINDMFEWFIVKLKLKSSQKEGQQSQLKLSHPEWPVVTVQRSWVTEKLKFM